MKGFRIKGIKYIFVILAFCVLIPVSGLCEEATLMSPPVPEAESCISRNALISQVKAVVVKSWSPDLVPAWSELNNEWSTYGTIPILIDYTTLGDTDFTYDDLVNSGADVIIISDPSGGSKQYTEAEIDAINSYASEGHNIIGTYLVLQHSSYDNRGLAPVFGLRSDLTYGAESITNTFTQIDTTDPLFTGLPSQSWTSQGYAYTQVPSDDNIWNNSDMAGAGIVAQADNFVGMISIYDTAAYTGIYFSNMPEYYGDANDKQLLYNAIVYSNLNINAIEGSILLRGVPFRRGTVRLLQPNEPPQFTRLLNGMFDFQTIVSRKSAQIIISIPYIP